MLEGGNVRMDDLVHIGTWGNAQKEQYDGQLGFQAVSWGFF